MVIIRVRKNGGFGPAPFEAGRNSDSRAAEEAVLSNQEIRGCPD